MICLDAGSDREITFFFPPLSWRFHIPKLPVITARMMVDSTRQSDWDPGISARQDTYSKAIPIDFDWTNRSDKYAPTGTLCVSVGGHGYACCYWQRGKRAPALFHFHPSHAICGDTGCTSWVRLRVCPACIPPVLRTLTSLPLSAPGIRPQFTHLER